VDLGGSEQGLVAGCCEHSDSSSGCGTTALVLNGATYNECILTFHGLKYCMKI
jgi:hypothetical protein